MERDFGPPRDTMRDDLGRRDTMDSDVGSRDFVFGATGLFICMAIAIIFAIAA
jgi:hypothetical protein